LVEAVSSCAKDGRETSAAPADLFARGRVAADHKSGLEMLRLAQAISD